MSLSQLFLLIILLLLTVGNIVYSFLAHAIFRTIKGWRKYKGPSVLEDLFLLLFTFPVFTGGGYIFFPLPLGIGLFVGAEPLLTLRKGDALESISIHVIWLAVVLSFIFIKRRKAAKKPK